MYKKILVPLDFSAADAAILEHLEKLQPYFKAEIHLLHVADGFAARNYDHLRLKESDEVREDRQKLAGVADRLRRQGMTVYEHLVMGEPADQIIRFAKEGGCDLLAMGAHGHRFMADMVFGHTVSKVRHAIDIPLLTLKMPKT